MTKSSMQTGRVSLALTGQEGRQCDESTCQQFWNPLSFSPLFLCFGSQWWASSNDSPAFHLLVGFVNGWQEVEERRTVKYRYLFSWIPSCRVASTKEQTPQVPGFLKATSSYDSLSWLSFSFPNSFRPGLFMAPFWIPESSPPPPCPTFVKSPLTKTFSSYPMLCCFLLGLCGDVQVPFSL